MSLRAKIRQKMRILRPRRNRRQNHHDSASSIASPLRFSPKINRSPQDDINANLPLALFLKDTSSLLKPEWAYLSPSFGAALTTTTLINNLLRISSTGLDEGTTFDNHIGNSSSLAAALFFQIIRESAIFQSRTKSMPAAHLAPKMIGGILSHSLFHPNEADFKKYLKDDYGIKSNKIHGDQWTGISLARWVDLLRFSSRNLTAPMDWLPMGVWLVALWESSESKECWLEYLLECDRVVKMQNKSAGGIFLEDNSLGRALQERDPHTIAEWSSRKFDTDELSASNIQTHMDQVIYFVSNGGSSMKHNPTEFSQAMEIVCAAIALSQTNYVRGEKPAVPNGYHNYDDGLFTADCVEVTVREIIDLLLWDDTTGKFDLSRLPNTAHSGLVNFYNKLHGEDKEWFLKSCSDNNQHSSDEDVQHYFEDTKTGFKWIGPRSSNMSKDFFIGKEWFELLSDLPGCDYFMKGKSGKLYELAPTMENVAKVCQRLLFSNSLYRMPAKEWSNLEELAKAWTPIAPLEVRSDTLLHRTSSETTAKHETATLKIPENPNCIEIRMRCDWEEESGFCAVSHLRHFRNVLNTNQVKSLQQECQAADQAGSDPLIQLLSVLTAPGDSENFDHAKVSGNSLLVRLLSTAFGCDRREIIQGSYEYSLLEENDNNNNWREVFRHRELEKSQASLRSALHKACDLAQKDPESCEILLKWLLQESPTVIESSSSVTLPQELSRADEDLERKLLSLSPQFWSSKVVEDALWNNKSGLIRGKILAAHARLQSGTDSLVEVLFSDDLSLRDVASLVSLTISNSRQ